ncbi:Sec-independent protein translocase subunit TatA [Streptomyces sp. BBFR2]|uniref:Sec-independent protein translocase subunit TatA n=1 Tax=Streptomyces sp. BBFR2 TaxID=3372854 RepID=UPI0037D9EA4A
MLRNAIEPWHLVLIIVAAVLLFGSKKLPDMARGLGRSMRILKSEAKALKDDRAPAATEHPATASATTAPRTEATPAGH